MERITATIPGAMTLAEMKEFANFSAATQRYIRRSLDVGLERADAVATWSRDAVEETNIKVQANLYRRLATIRGKVPDACTVNRIEAFMPPLIAITSYDLSQGRLTNFPAYRFLYERLIGAEVRPWLPSAYCAAAALPNLHPDTRKDLLQSISEAAATAPGWSNRAPSFFPEWVEKVGGGEAFI